MFFFKEEIIEGFKFQAEICSRTSDLYGDILDYFSKNDEIVTLVSEISKKTNFLNRIELIALFPAFFHYECLANNKDFQEIKKFFKTQNGNYNTQENKSALEKEIDKIVSLYPDNIENWLILRKLQTNESNRACVLFPAISSLNSEKITLVELGCSAGLLLMQDKFNYNFFSNNEENYFIKNNESDFFLNCKISNPKSLEKYLNKKLNIVQKIGLDLNPLNIFDENELNFLKSSIWDDEQRIFNINFAVQLMKENNNFELIKNSYLEDLTKILNIKDNDSDVVFYTSASTYQIDDNMYNKLLNNLKSFSDNYNKKVYFIEFEDIRKDEIKQIKKENLYHVSIRDFNEEKNYQFSMCHFHGKSMELIV